MLKFIKTHAIALAYLLFTIVSLIMLYNSHQFSRRTGLSGPQIGLPNEGNTDRFIHLKEYLNNGNAYNFFEGFFLADMFFMLSVTLLLLAIIYKFRIHNKSSKKGIFFTFAFLGIASWLADIIENLNYLSYTSSFLHNIEKIKIGLIAILFLGFLWWLLYNIIFPHSKLIFDYLKSSSISLLCLMIMTAGLTFMPQGATLIVDIFEQDSIIKICINLGILFLLTNLLAVILSHFPIFMEFAFNQKDKVEKWKATKAKSFFKIITYVNYNEITTIKNYLRYILGIATYAALFFVIMKAFSLYGVSKFPAESTVLFSTTFVCIIFYYLWRLFDRDKILFFKMLKHQPLDPTSQEAINFFRWMKWFWVSFWTGFAIFILWLIIASTLKWHYFTLLITLIAFILNTLCFCLFRITRKYLIFYLGNGTMINEENHEEFNFSENSFHSKNSFSNILPQKKKNTFINFIYSYFAGFSNNVKYIDRINITAYLAFAFLLFNILLPELNYVTYFSGINMLLAFIITIYGAIIASIKRLIYNNSIAESIIAENSPARISSTSQLGIQSQRSFFPFKSKILSIPLEAKKLWKEYKNWKLAAPAIFILLTVGYKYAKSTSTIHKMEMVSFNTNAVSITKFIDDINNYIQDTETKSLIQIASYGGGLKANLWNLLTLNTLNDSLIIKENSPCNLMERTISLSGVSGGMVGIGNYVAFKYARDEANPEEIIDKIGSSNIVSYDIAGLLGHDLIFGLLSNKNKQYLDRSDLAMKHYWDIIKKSESQDLTTQSLNSSFKKLYDESYRYPAIIVNSASSHSKPGVGISLSGEGVKEMFKGYNMFQNSKDSSDLSFYDAVSTSNRFPIMSPAAQVENLGHFLDGGYFENSGLLSSDKFAKYIAENITDSINFDIIQICIINSQGDYINKFISDNAIELKSLKPQTNSQSIISGVTDIDKLPKILRASKQNDPNYHEIYLPHLISVPLIE